ncbi:MAG: class I SAM-dependent methyltransferase [Bdellovibrionales bacterium]|nr:class I SAM-dependent methyltransferase [Bdellovibrionales bacterium]
MDSRPDYDFCNSMEGARQGMMGEVFCKQILNTCGPFFVKPLDQLDVLDVGAGYGWTARSLALRCRSVTGLEPCLPFYEAASRDHSFPNLVFRNADILNSGLKDTFDLIVLDNVYEHLPDQKTALDQIVDVLRPGGVVYLLMPNRLWPIEVHYGLPFLSYLPLRFANLYLKLTKRGKDYRDASYAPTYWGLCANLNRHPSIEYQFVVPSDLSLTQSGGSWVYRLGAMALKHCPSLWCISKAFLVVARKS